MPCTYTGSLEGDRALAAEEHIAELKRELDLSTRLLCETMTYLQNNARFEIVTHVLELDGMRAWWKEHQKRDKRRKKKG